MKKFLILATALLAGTAVAQTVPVAQPAPAVPPAPMAHPMHDKAMTRAEVVQMVRDHFGQMDVDKNGAITTAEIDQSRDKVMKDFKSFDRGHGMTMGDPNAAFDRLDTNKDGSISRDEFTKAREERVERRIERREERKDSPKDGKDVRRHVMRMHGPGGMGGGRMIVMADTNGDGQITMAEAEALALQHFDQMDTNKDGQVTPEERRAGRPLIIKQIREEKKTGS